jgi:hypothetical protein
VAPGDNFEFLSSFQHLRSKVMNRKLCVILAAMVVMFASSAFAGLLINVQAVPGDGYTVADGGKSINVIDPSALVQFEVFATISGKNAILTDERYTMVSGGFKLTRSSGNTSALSLPDVLAEDGVTVLTKGYLPPYDSLKTSAVTITDTLIGKEGATNATGAWAARTANSVFTTHSPETYALGYFALTVRTDGYYDGPISVNYVKPGTGIGAYTFTIDGVAGTAADISVGMPCTLLAIPEPATLVLLGMGALALVFVRRRRG